MKKNYLEPRTESIEFETGALMEGIISGETGEVGTGEGVGDGEDLVGGRRGEWGNVWK